MNFEFSTDGLESYLTDKNAERNGVWLKFARGYEFLVVRAGRSNPSYVRAMSRAMRPHQRDIDRGTLDPAISAKILRKVFCEQIIKDWKGPKDKNTGQPIPYSPEAAIAFFEWQPDLFADVQTLATEMNTFVIEEAEEAKND